MQRRHHTAKRLQQNCKKRGRRSSAKNFWRFSWKPSGASQEAPIALRNFWRNFSLASLKALRSFFKRKRDFFRIARELFREVLSQFAGISQFSSLSSFSQFSRNLFATYSQVLRRFSESSLHTFKNYPELFRKLPAGYLKALCSSFGSSPELLRQLFEAFLEALRSFTKTSPELKFSTATSEAFRRDSSSLEIIGTSPEALCAFLTVLQSFSESYAKLSGRYRGALRSFLGLIWNLCLADRKLLQLLSVSFLTGLRSFSVTPSETLWKHPEASF